MKEVSLALPAFGFVVATRAALGLGVGLLLANRLPERQRRLTGAALLGVGAITTIPAAVAVIRGVRRAGRHAALRLEKGSAAAIGRDARLIGATRFPRKGDEAF
jgi:hypothetical protein